MNTIIFKCILEITLELSGAPVNNSKSETPNPPFSFPSIYIYIILIIYKFIYFNIILIIYINFIYL